MRIALVCPYSLDQPGGVATHVLGLARWLVSAGHEAHVFAPGTRSVDAGVPVTLLGGSLALPFNGSVAHLGLDTRQARRAAELVAGFDVVHVHEPLTPGIAYRVARGAPRLVVTHHAAFEPGRLTSAVLRARAARLPRRVTLAVSPAAERLVGRGAGVSARVVPNAIALPEPPMRQEPRGDVVFVGRIAERRKGYRLFADLAGRIPEARFVAVGDGGSGAPRVNELGRLDDAGLGRVLERAAVLVAPNLFGESFGMVLVEALAHGASVVVSDLPAFRDVVDDPRVSGFFPVGDLDHAARLVRERLAAPADPALARGAAARFGWDVVGPQIIEAYRQAC